MDRFNVSFRSRARSPSRSCIESAPLAPSASCISCLFCDAVLQHPELVIRAPQKKCQRWQVRGPWQPISKWRLHRRDNAETLDHPTTAAPHDTTAHPNAKYDANAAARACDDASRKDEAHACAKEWPNAATYAIQPARTTRERPRLCRIPRICATPAKVAALSDRGICSSTCRVAANPELWVCTSRELWVVAYKQAVARVYADDATTSLLPRRVLQPL